MKENLYCPYCAPQCNSNLSIMDKANIPYEGCEITFIPLAFVPWDVSESGL